PLADPADRGAVGPSPAALLLTWEILQIGSRGSSRGRCRPPAWQPWAMSTANAPNSCPACRIIDQADGVEDGNLYKVEHYQTRDERSVLNALLRAQDRAADQITNFAGSLKFVYLHSIWFGIWILINVGILGASLKFDKFPFGL